MKIYLGILAGIGAFVRINAQQYSIDFKDVKKLQETRDQLLDQDPCSSEALRAFYAYRYRCLIDESFATTKQLKESDLDMVQYQYLDEEYVLPIEKTGYM